MLQNKMEALFTSKAQLLKDSKVGGFQGQKLYFLNRDSAVLSELFQAQKKQKLKSGGDETKKTIRTKLTKGNLRAAISRRYKGSIAERILSKFPEFHYATDFDSYVELIEKLINIDENERFLRIAFDIFDFN